MSAENGMFTKSQRSQMQLAHGNEVGHKKGVKELILTTVAGVIATGIVYICFVGVGLLSL